MEWTLDTVIEHADRKSADFLNACHACRPAHPLYSSDGNPWRNLAFMLQGRIRGDAIDWVNKQADAYDRDIRTLPTLGTTSTGGLIKMRRPLRHNGGLVPAEIVLCFLPHNEVTPFATWQRNTAEFEGTYWGHYFGPGEADAAIADFKTRAT